MIVTFFSLAYRWLYFELSVCYEKENYIVISTSVATGFSWSHIVNKVWDTFPNPLCSLRSILCLLDTFIIGRPTRESHDHSRAPWLRGRASDSRLRGLGFESCAAVLKPWASFFTLHCSSSLSCINEYRAIDSGGYVYEPLRINCSIWLDASQRSWDGVWVNRSAREVKCKVCWAILRTAYCAIWELTFIYFMTTK